MRPFLQAHWTSILFIVVALESLAAFLLEDAFQLHGGIPWLDYYFVFAAATFTIGLFAFLITLWNLWRRGEKRPTRWFLSRGSVLWSHLIILATLPAFMASHTTFKALIPKISEYWADPPLAKLDHMIFGADAWTITHALIGMPETKIIDQLYFAWFLVTYLTLLAIVFLPKLAEVRGRLILTYVISWIFLGAALAVAFPSVGPCFFDSIYGGSRFAPLTEQLRIGNLNAVQAQQKLWFEHVRDTVGFGSGLSAMPSMHVSVAYITSLTLRHVGARLLGTIWVATIWLGSVHLGWHYAVDGLIGLVGCWLVWMALGWQGKRTGSKCGPSCSRETSPDAGSGALGEAVPGTP